MNNDATIAKGEMTGCGTKSGNCRLAHQQANSDADAESEDSADDRDDGGLGQELVADVTAVAPRALRTPISRVRSVTLTSMMFITPIPPSDKRHQGDGAEEESHHAEDALRELGAVERVPDKERLFIVWLEVMLPAEDLVNLVHAPSRAARVETGSTTMLLIHPLEIPGLSGGGKSRAMEE